MIFKMLKTIKSFFTISVSDDYQTEFAVSINKINIARAKITAITFIILEMVMLVASCISKKGDFLKKPNIYYGAMYLLLLSVMIVYLLIFFKLGKNIPVHGTGIQCVGISFSSILLLWCAGISLLDQMSSGEIIIYCVAIISIAAVPVFKPVAALIVYLPVHALFIVLMPYFYKVNGTMYGNYINSSTILVVSLAVSYMRYKKQVEDFNLRKIIQEKNDELGRINIELEEANKKLEKLSLTDGLTGIFNRFAFDKILKSEWDRCKRHFAPLSLIMIDIDYFKAFNDNYGHQVGDDCLKRVAGVLIECAKRSSDTVARYGGEEFAVILPYMEKESAIELAEYIRKMVEELAIRHTDSSISEYVTISLGVNTVVPSNGTTIDEFIRNADKALYTAKIERNNIVAV